MSADVSSETFPDLEHGHQTEHVVRIIGLYDDEARMLDARADGRSFYHLHEAGRLDLVPDACLAVCTCDARGDEQYPTMFEARWWCREHRLSVGLPCQERIGQAYLLR